MAIVPAICTQCGAAIKVDETKEAAICEHCGTPFIVEKAISNFHVQNTIYANNVIMRMETKEFDIKGGTLLKYLGSALDVKLPEEVYEIADGAFENMYLRGIVFNENLRKIGNHSFKNCTLLEHIGFATSKVSHIGDQAFMNCRQLRSYDFSCIESIGLEAFSNTGLTEIEFPNHEVAVAGKCFCGCHELRKADLKRIMFKNDPAKSDLRLSLFDDTPKLLDIHTPEVDRICDSFKSMDEVILKPSDEWYCAEVLGDCAFFRFFSDGDIDGSIQCRDKKCMFCGGNMRTVRDGFFKSHKECELCKRPIPTYKEIWDFTQS